MKMKIVCGILAFALVLSVALLLFFSTSKMKNVKTTKAVQLVDKDRLCQISSQDMQHVLSILDNKTLFRDNLSCGFSERFAIKLDERLIEIAEDGCNYLLDSETSKYIKISDEEREFLLGLFSFYGLDTPKH